VRGTYPQPAAAGEKHKCAGCSSFWVNATRERLRTVIDLKVTRRGATVAEGECDPLEHPLPTIYLLDHKGTIRFKANGRPEPAVEQLLKEAEKK
jgi:hypothetical protein